MLRSKLQYILVFIIILAISFWWKSRSTPEERIVIETAEKWFKLLDETNPQTACSKKFLGENWSISECIKEMSEVMGDKGHVKSRSFDDTIHLSDLLSEHTNGERYLLTFETKFEKGHGQENIILSLQEKWKIDGYFIH